MENFLQERRDYLNLLSDTLNNITLIHNINSRINKLGNYIISEISKGNLLEKEFLYIYVVLNKEQFQNKQNYDINKLIENLSNIFKNFPDNSKEIFAINDNILLLNFLENNLEKGFENYIKNILTFDFHAGINFNYTQFFPQICVLFDLKEVLKDTLRKVFKNYLNYKKKQRRSILNWVWQCLWPNQFFLQKRGEVNDIYPILKDILYNLIEKNKIDEVMIFSMFIFNIMINVIDDPDKIYRKLQYDITEPCCELYKKWINKNKNLLEKHEYESESNKKIKIAIVRPHIGYWSPFKIEYSLLKSLINNNEFNKKYEIEVYSFDSLDLWAGKGDDPKCIKMFNEAGIKYKSPTKVYNERYGYYTNYLKKILDFRRVFVNDKIDIIIYSDHLYSIGEFLFLSRTAPKQIYWTHGNFAIDIEGIDKRIAHFNPSDKVFKWKNFNVPIAQEFLIGTEEDKKEGLKIKKEFLEKFGDDTVILGTIGRLTKLNSDEYLKTISEIMEENPNTIYLACGEGDRDVIKQKIKKFGIDKKRFIFKGHVSSHVYGWVIDVYLDSFPLKGGQSVEEFRAKGGVVVRYLEKEKMDIFNKFFTQFFNVYNVESLFSNDENVLIEIKAKVYEAKNERIKRHFESCLRISLANLFLFVWVDNIENYKKLANFYIKNPKFLKEVRRFYPSFYFKEYCKLSRFPEILF